MTPQHVAVEPTMVARIYSSGPIEAAKQVLRAECLREGLCVTIEPTHYIYTGGEESGFVVGLVNYPRFPTTEKAFQERAFSITQLLLEACFQHSILLVESGRSTWISRRAQA